MINRHPAVRIFVNEGECRAGDSSRAAQAGGETLNKLGFAAAKVASQGDDIARFDIFCEAPNASVSAALFEMNVATWQRLRVEGWELREAPDSREWKL